MKMGNPLKSEGAAFRWLVAVLIGAGLVILASELISSAAGAALGFVLIAVVTVLVVKGMVHMLGSPDDDEPDAAEEPHGRQAPPTGSDRDGTR
jgi:hypothetical protein